MLEEGRVDLYINKHERIKEIFREAAIKCCLLAALACPGSSGLKEAQEPVTGSPRFVLYGVPLTLFMTESQVGRGLSLSPGKSPIFLSNKCFHFNYTALLKC